MLGVTKNDILSIIRTKYVTMEPYLNERNRRIWAANEARMFGHGGKKLLQEATGLSYPTIKKGMDEIKLSGSEKTDIRRIRKHGGGRKKNSSVDKLLEQEILNIVESSTMGDPEAPLLWTSKSTRNIANELNKNTQRASHTLVATILRNHEYSLQSNRKTKEGLSNPDRDKQFNFISAKTKDFFLGDQPVISVDTKKKEKVGNFKNNGQEYCKKDCPTKVNVYDFIDKELGKVSPYGIYDLSRNKGWVSVGISSDTAAFAVNSIRSWWSEMGKSEYANADKIYINADGGGSNGWRTRLWKTELQKLSNEINMVIHISHFPPGTSKWNKIEHKMFCFISKNWRGKPLIDTATIVNLIANTTTKSGLRIKAKLDERQYQKGIKISDEELASVNIVKENFHGEWNYKIVPQN